MGKKFFVSLIFFILLAPTIASSATKTVTIDWTIPDTQNVQSYRMYYSYSIDMSGKILADNCTVLQKTIPEDFSITCSNVNIDRYPVYFAIAAVTIENNEIYSDPVTAEITVVQNFQILAPTNVSPPDQLVDNGHENFTVVGTWNASTAMTGYYGENYQVYPAGDGTQTATWYFAIPVSGQYEIFARWSAYSNRATNAPYSIINNSQLINTIPVNQTINGGIFYSLGTFNLTNGVLQVTLTNNANNYVIADAIQISFIK